MVKKIQEKLKKSHNFGFSKSSFWARLRIKNKAEDKKLWYLVSHYFLQDEIKLFKKKEKGWSFVKTGDTYPFSTREVKGRPFIFKIYPKKESLYFVRFEGTTNQIDLSLTEPEVFMSSAEEETYVMGLFFGLVLAMVAYNSFIFVSTKSLSYLFYVFYVFLYGINLSIWKGFLSRFYIWNYPWFNNNFLVFLTGFIILFLSLFTTSFLKINNSTPKLFNVMKSFAWLGFLIVPLSFFLPYSVGTKLWMFGSLLLLLTILFAGIYKIKQGFRSAKYFVSAFVFMIVGTIISLFGILGILPNIFVINYAAIIGTALELVFLSMGLADRFNLVQEESLRVEREAKEIQKRYASDLEKEVKERTRELFEEKNSVANLLDNMGQAVFTIDIEGVIQSKAVSKYSEELFGKNIKGLDFYDLVFSNLPREGEEFSEIQFGLVTCIGADSLQWQLNKDLVPRKTTIQVEGQTKVLDIRPNAIFDEGTIVDIMMTITDITEKESLAKEMAIREIEESRRARVLHELAPPEGKDISLYSKEIKIFLLETRDLIEENNSIFTATEKKEVLSKEDFQVVFRNLHTIKGSSRAYSLTNLSGFIHKIESEILELGEENFKEIIASVESTHQEFEYYQKIAKEVFSISTDKGEIEETIFTEIYKINIEILKREISGYLREPSEENLKNLKKAEENLAKTPFLQHLQTFNKMVAELSEELKKKIHFSCEGDELYLSGDAFNLLNDSIIHLVRNSIDHGIEKDREDKNTEGTLEIFCQEKEGHYILSIKDDGKGIDGQKISSRAIDKKITTLKDVSEMTEEDKVNLVFHPGFSTVEKVTELSGRGVGMDVVKKNIEKLGGTIKIITSKGKGTEFLINIPEKGIDYAK